MLRHPNVSMRLAEATPKIQRYALSQENQRPGTASQLYPLCTSTALNKVLMKINAHAEETPQS